MSRRSFLIRRHHLRAAAMPASARTIFSPRPTLTTGRWNPTSRRCPCPNTAGLPTAAYEAFRDIKYGVRLHWGLYSIKGEPKESWPFLEMSFAERQRYQELYKTWNPQGFNADEWMDLFAAGGMKMFAFTSKHHDGFSMFHTQHARPAADELDGAGRSAHGALRPCL